VKLSRLSINNSVIITGLLPALGAVILWGSNAVIARHLSLEGVSMTAVAFLRTIIGGLVLGIWIAVKSPGTLRDSGTLLGNRWVWIALVCYGANMLVFHWALAHTSASVVMILENIAPVVALFGGAWLFHERLTWRAILALGLSLSGVVLVAMADPGINAVVSPGAAIGNFLAIVAGLTWGGYTLACRGHGQSNDGHKNGMIATMIMLLGSAILLLPSLIGVDGWPGTVTAWGWVIVLGIFHTALATVLWRLALVHIPAFTASMIFLLTIVLTMINAVVFLNERLTPLMIIGACAIIAALLTLTIKSAAKNLINED
jgi:drug/metabolite transporter (DMT)-like permease